MCILWSPVLRDMINLYPTPALLESTHGLAYLLHVDEDGPTWAAVLDLMYPVQQQQQALTDWVRTLVTLNSALPARQLQRCSWGCSSSCTRMDMLCQDMQYMMQDRWFA
jgi:hypothetical protein